MPRVLINPASTRLHASTIAIDDPGLVIDYLPPTGGAAFGRMGDIFVGLGEIARIETDSIAEADQWWAEHVAVLENETELPGTFGVGPLCYGSFVFDPQTSKQKSLLVIPETIIGRRNGQCWLTKIGYDRVTPTMPVRQPAPRPSAGLRFETGAFDDDAWMARVRDAVAAVRAGELNKVVLSHDLIAAADEPIDLRWPLQQLIREHVDSWSFLIDGMVGSTAQMLVRREAGLTVSRVLAGGALRLTNSPDIEQAARLIASVKDQQDHALTRSIVVDALAPFMTGMHVPSAPYVLALPNMMQLATDVSGVTDPQTSTLALAAACHPSAMTCGSPVDLAHEYLRANDQVDRGRFGGPIGWMDVNGDGEWTLALRCGQQLSDPSQVRLYAGAGVVAQSRAHAELVETQAKWAPMRNALASQFDQV